MNTKTTVKIDGIEYELDLQRAKQMGIIKESKKINDFEIGDLFIYENTNWFVVVRQGYFSDKYTIIGLDDSFRHFSDCGTDGLSKSQMLGFLNRGGEKIFVKNINEDFTNVVKLLLQIAKRG